MGYIHTRYVRVGAFRYEECFWKVLTELTCDFRRSLGIGENSGMTCGQRTGDSIASIHTVALLNSDAVVCCPSILPWGVSRRGPLQLGADTTRFGLLFMRGAVVLVLESTQQGGRCYRAVQYFCTTGGPMLSGGMLFFGRR